jgi:hypothetical protein
VDYTTGNTTPTGKIGIRFKASSLLTAGGNIYLDNFQLSAQPVVQTVQSIPPVPEPGVFTLISMGLVLLRLAQRARNPSKICKDGKKGLAQ